MGSTCTSKRRNKSELQVQNVPVFLPQVGSPTQGNSEEKHHFEPTIHNWLKLIELIDTQHSFSKELLTDLNKMIITRTFVLFNSQKPISTIINNLSQSVQIIKKLQGNEEFEFYFPILSHSFYILCVDMEAYLRQYCYNSTKCHSQVGSASNEI